ncbi:hypothetical protein [Moraxella lacunata]|uniref:hypothetical protein n=1 Tax=Moraxella lacunata TaxID=477 RepID=UPI003EE17963
MTSDFQAIFTGFGKPLFGLYICLRVVLKVWVVLAQIGVVDNKKTTQNQHQSILGGVSMLTQTCFCKLNIKSWAYSG